MGAAGRDFHNFNVLFRHSRTDRVVCFTAAQIPNIAGRRYPPELAGRLYPRGIPIYHEDRLAELIRSERAEQVILSYSDLSHADVMQKAALVTAAGADFRLLGAARTMLPSSKPVIAVTAVRTGCGKSQATRHVADILRGYGKSVAVVRHPMPYGNLREQAVQRFATYDDLEKHQVTIEEREEYEPLLERGLIVYAGVDYERILRQAEREADVVIWDGGNNDTPFYRPDLWIVLADPLRPGHEVSYYPGLTNLRAAHVAIINKERSATRKNIELVRRNIKAMNPAATIIDATSIVTASNPQLLKHKRVLVVEDGPTLTHGGMAYGAGTVAAERARATIVDPRPYLTPELRQVFARFPHLGKVLPAMGYGERQVADLKRCISRVPCDVVVSGTPIDLRKVLSLAKPVVRIRYELEELGKPDLEGVLRRFGKAKR
ncbi:MAG: GTPase [Candidatus Aenigmarchaeota archaeon]|nr:GTPase [Candidatus Aenigmarchaeota archaeon]